MSCCQCVRLDWVKTNVTMFVEFSLLLSTIVTVGCGYFFYQRRKKVCLRQNLGIPGPKPNVIFGNLLSMMTPDWSARQSVLYDWKNEFGKVFGYYMGPSLFVVVTDVEVIKEVLIKQFNCFTDRMDFLVTESIVFQGLIGLEGEKWRSLRHVISPVFTSNKMRAMSKTIHNRLDIFMENLTEYHNKGTSFDIYKYLTENYSDSGNTTLGVARTIFRDFEALSLDVMGVTTLGVDLKCQNEPDSEFLKNIHEFLYGMDAEKNPVIILALLFPEFRIVWSKLFAMTSKMGSSERWLVNALTPVIASRRQMKGQDATDILQLMLEQTSAELDDSTLIANMLTFLLAGYETTATALGFAAYLLASHSDAQQRLQAEIDEKQNQEGELSYESVMHKLPYLDAFYRESLRLYPPVIEFVVRTCVEKCSIGSTNFVPGVQVVVPQYMIHRDQDLWPEPNEFKPERFLDDTTHQAMTWLPFGAGPRNCIGMRFAEMEYKMCITRLLSKYSLAFANPENSQLKIEQNGVTIRPANGVLVKLVKR